MNVCGDWFYVMLLHQGSLVKATKESNFKLSISVFFANNFGWPIGKSFLLGIYNFVEWSTRFGKPMFVSPKQKYLVSR